MDRNRNPADRPGLNPSTSDGEARAPGAEALRARLRDVYWIGGGSGAGKSTVARRLAARHGLRLYATDDVMADHGRRSTPADSPFMAEFAAMDMDERWVSRPPETMLETFGWFRGEGFGLIVEDLLRLPPGVIAEGFRLLPRLVRPLLVRSRPRGLALPDARLPPRRVRPAGARCSRSPGRPAIRTRPCTTCSNATGCSPTGSGRRLRDSACPSSTWTPR